MDKKIIENLKELEHYLRGYGDAVSQIRKNLRI
jgi:hypothetical protein